HSGQACTSIYGTGTAPSLEGFIRGAGTGWRPVPTTRAPIFEPSATVNGAAYPVPVLEGLWRPGRAGGPRGTTPIGLLTGTAGLAGLAQAGHRTSPSYSRPIPRSVIGLAWCALRFEGVIVRINDVGGVQGFGPIEVDEPEEPFHYEWESRVFALVRTVLP